MNREELIKSTLQKQDILDTIAYHCNLDELKRLSETNIPGVKDHIGKLIERCSATNSTPALLPRAMKDIIIMSHYDVEDYYSDPAFFNVKVLNYDLSEFNTCAWKNRLKKVINLQYLLNDIEKIEQIELKNVHGYFTFPITQNVSFTNCDDIRLDAQSFRGANTFGLKFKSSNNLLMDASVLPRIRKIAFDNCQNFNLRNENILANPAKELDIIKIDNSSVPYILLVAAALVVRNIGYVRIKNSTSEMMATSQILEIARIDLKHIKKLELIDQEANPFLVNRASDEIHIQNSQATINLDLFHGTISILGDRSRVNLSASQNKIIEHLKIVHDFPFTDFPLIDLVNCERIKVLETYEHGGTLLKNLSHFQNIEIDNFYLHVPRNIRTFQNQLILPKLNCKQMFIDLSDRKEYDEYGFYIIVKEMKKVYVKNRIADDIIENNNEESLDVIDY